MPVKLQSITLQAPGFRGLNLQAGSLFPNFEWAQTANNLVFDEGGRLSARKGCDLQSTNDASSNGYVVTHVYKKDKDTAIYVMAHDDSGTDSIVTLASPYTGSPTDRTGSTAPTASDWQFVNYNAKVVGFQQDHKPVIWDGVAANFTLLQEEHSDWAAGTTYAEGDTVKALSSAHQDYYMYCSTAGDSHASTEPTWSPTDGGTITDNTAVWTYVKIPQGNAVHSAFGRLWAFDETGTVLYWSEIEAPHKWFGGTAAKNNLTKARGFQSGVDYGKAITDFANRLIVFGSENILVFAGVGGDPADTAPASDMILEDVIFNIGCKYRDTISSTGEDILFLDETGVRSLKRNALFDSGRVQLKNVSQYVRDSLNTQVLAASGHIFSEVHHQDGFYILGLQTGTSTQFWVFDIKFPNEDETLKVTTWDSNKIYSMAWDEFNSRLIFGCKGDIGFYQNYKDEQKGSTNAERSYNAEYLSSWSGLDSPLIKIPKEMKIIFLRGGGYTVTHKWAFDFDATKSSTNNTTISSVASESEYGLAEYGVNEFNGKAFIVTETKSPMSRAGENFRFGWETNICNEPLSFQKVTINMKIGRISI